MARPIIGLTPVQSTAHGLQPTQRSLVDKRRALELLRVKRSNRYLEAMSRLDAGAHLADRAGIEGLIQVFIQEFPELGRGHAPLGIAARCLLGPPYEVHICDFAGTILEHFPRGRPMPAIFERARSLALHPGYACVEVYSDHLVAIGLDGQVAIIESRSDV
jgi:hypothetical protein